jgi:hypothetical protein
MFKDDIAVHGRIHFGGPAWRVVDDNETVSQLVPHDLGSSAYVESAIVGSGVRFEGVEKFPKGQAMPILIGSNNKGALSFGQCLCELLKGLERGCAS